MGIAIHYAFWRAAMMAASVGRRPNNLTSTPLGRVGVTGPRLWPTNGTICVPIECRIPSGVSTTALIISQDDGRTFSAPIMVAGDENGHLNLCDARFDLLPDD